MRPNKTLLGAKARKAVLDGVNAIYIPVAKTLGPQGKSVLLFRTFGRGPRITDDGYTVAECQLPKDPFIALAAQSFKETCMRTNEKVGDGTTTTAVIGGFLMNEIYHMISDNNSEMTAKQSKAIGVMTLRSRILKTAEKVKEEIKKSAKKTTTLKELEHIATISCKDEELGKVVAKMAHEVGVDGFIDVVEGFKGEIETEINKGFRFPAKIVAKAFITDAGRFEMVAKDSAVFITNYALDNVAEIGDPLRQFNQQKVSKIVVIAPSFSDSVLVEFTKAIKAGYEIYPVGVPSLRTDQFEDLSTYCGATFFDKSKGKALRSAKVDDLGFLEKIVVKDVEAKEDAVILGGAGTREQEFMSTEEIEVERNGKKHKEKQMKKRTSTAIAERIEELKGQHKETREDRFKKLLERRIASMSSSVGIIRVGDSTQASSLFKKLKIEDAVYACKAALRGGYVKGGGLCLKEIAEKLPETDILRNALMAPYKQIQASFETETEIGPDIIDPAEAVYYAVEHATNAVANLATVEAITPEMDETQPGDGYMQIAKGIHEFVIANKKYWGQLKEGEEEAERDRLNGLTTDEMVTLDRG